MKFNWTPRQVDEEVPADLIPWWMTVVEMYDEMHAEAQKRAIEEAKRSGSG